MISVHEESYDLRIRDLESRKPVWRWPNEIPIAGEPADVVETVSAYNAWLQKTELPKLMLFASPGAIMPRPLVEWCRGNLKNLQTVELGEGIHFLYAPIIPRNASLFP